MVERGSLFASCDTISDLCQNCVISLFSSFTSDEHVPLTNFGGHGTVPSGRQRKRPRRRSLSVLSAVYKMFDATASPASTLILTTVMRQNSREMRNDVEGGYPAVEIPDPVTNILTTQTGHSPGQTLIVLVRLFTSSVPSTRLGT